MHRSVLPATLDAHLLALRRNLAKRELIEEEKACHGIHIGDNVLVNRKIDGTFMNIGVVQDVQPENQITLKLRGKTETIHCNELAKIPPAYEFYQGTVNGAAWDQYRKIPATRRIKLPGKDFAQFRKKIMRRY